MHQSASGVVFVVIQHSDILKIIKWEYYASELLGVDITKLLNF